MTSWKILLFSFAMFSYVREIIYSLISLLKAEKNKIKFIYSTVDYFLQVNISQEFLHKEKFMIV